MLHPFRITSGNLRADADRQQEVLHDLMALAALWASFSPSGVKKIRAGDLFNKTDAGQAFEHFSDRRLRNAKTRGHIHLARLAHFVDQIGDQLHIVIDQLAAMRFPHLAKPFHVLFNIH